MARKTHYRRIQAKQKEAIVLLSGGMVEHIYLKVLIRELKISNLLNSNHKILPHYISGGETKAGRNILTLLDKALFILTGKDEKIIADKIYLIADYDEILNNKTLKARFEQKLKTLKKYKERFKLVLTYPCIELWFLLHLSYTTKSFTDCNQVIKELKRNKHFLTYDKSKSFFEKNNLWQLLNGYEGLNTATKNLERLNSYKEQNNCEHCGHSNLDELLKALIGQTF